MQRTKWFRYCCCDPSLRRSLKKLQSSFSKIIPAILCRAAVRKKSFENVFAVTFRCTAIRKNHSRIVADIFAVFVNLCRRPKKIVVECFENVCCDSLPRCRKCASLWSSVVLCCAVCRCMVLCGAVVLCVVGCCALLPCVVLCGTGAV